MFEHVNDEGISPETRAHVRDAYYWLLFQFVSSVRDDLNGRGRGVAEWLLLQKDGKYRRPLAAADVLHRLGRKDEAFAILSQYRNVRNWYANQLRVNLLFEDGEYIKAVEAAKHASELMPEHREVWNSLYCACQKVNDVQGANRALAKAKDTWAREQAIIADLRKLYTR